VSLANPLEDERVLKAFEGKDTEKALHKAARFELVEEKQSFANDNRRHFLLETLQNRYVFPLPRVMIDAEKAVILQEEDEPELFDTPEGQQDLETMAKRRVSLAFLFLKYASVHNIQVNNEDLARFIWNEVDGDRNLFAKTIESLKKDSQQLLALKNAVLEVKVLSELLGKVPGTKRYALFSDFLLERSSFFFQKMKNLAEYPNL
jgi:FKBP-type peptidyl-prolyl cis-trans isomerase (trigger factor)